MAAALAEAQLDRVVDPGCRDVLEMIARDEAQHSALAWRAVQRFLERGGLPVARALRAELSALSEMTAAPAGAPRMNAARWNHYGRLTNAQERLVIDQAWAELIAPAAKLLLARWELPELGADA